MNHFPILTAADGGFSGINRPRGPHPRAGMTVTQRQAAGRLMNAPNLDTLRPGRRRSESGTPPWVSKGLWLHFPFVRAMKRGVARPSSGVARWAAITLLLATTVAVTFPVIAPVSGSPAVRGCNSPCIYPPPFPAGSGWTHVAPVQTGSGMNSLNGLTPTASTGGEVWLSSISYVGSANGGSSSAGTASQEVKGGFEVYAGTMWPTGTWEQDYGFSITANAQGHALGYSSTYCPSGTSASASAWIEIRANMYDATSGRFVLSSDQTVTVATFSIGCNSSFNENIGNWTVFNDVIYPSLTQGHSYYWYFYMDIQTQASCGPGGSGALSWIDVQQAGNNALADNIIYWY